MVWDTRKLAIEVVEVFAEATAWRETTYDPELRIENAVRDHSSDAAYSANYYKFKIKLNEEKLEAYRKRKREEARMRRRGKIGRPSTRYVQIDLPYMEQAIMREKLPNDRKGVIQKFTIYSKHPTTHELEETDIYLTANVYPDDYANAARQGQLGEVFVVVGKAGGTEAIYDEWAKTTSRSLQYGVPVDDLFWQHVGTRFYPEGRTGNVDFPSCTSILDLISRYILSRHGSPESKARIAKMQIRQEPAVQP
jgi:hypothetical protein